MTSNARGEAEKTVTELQVAPSAVLVRARTR